MTRIAATRFASITVFAVAALSFATRTLAADPIPALGPIATPPALSLQASQAASTQASFDAARLMAAEVAARAKKIGPGGHFAPPPQRTIVQPTTASVAAPVMPATAAAVTDPAAPKDAATAEIPPGAVGARFMPLKRNMAAREFPLQGRGDVQARVEALRATVAPGKNTQALGRTALDAANAASPAEAAAAEMKRYSETAAATETPSTPAAATTAAAAARTTVPTRTGSAIDTSGDPEARAKLEMLEAVRRYRTSHGGLAPSLQR